MTEELFRADAYAKSCEARVTSVGPSGIRLDRTVFYPMGGGQPGDAGTLAAPDGRSVRIADTVKDPATAEPLHVPAAGAPELKVGDTVTAAIDWDRRYKHMRIHSCLHLLCSLIKGGVTGGSVGEGKGRLDFDLPDTSLDKEAITAQLQALVEANHPVAHRWITDDEMANTPDLVRTMSVKPPAGQGRVRLIEVAGVDLQPCGGTHVKSTGEIGRARIAKIENKGKHNRRVNIVLDD